MQLLLPELGLICVPRVDSIRELADRHYSRQKVGAREFMPPGSTLVLRDAAGEAVFGWVLNAVPRLDGELGVCCTIFRNESSRLSSEIVREADAAAWARWPEQPRHFTYVDPAKVSSVNPGYCFKLAGWRFVRRSLTGLHLLAITAASEV